MSVSLEMHPALPEPRRWSLLAAVLYSLLVGAVLVSAQVVMIVVLGVVVLVRNPDADIDGWMEGIGSNGLVFSIMTIATAFIIVPLIRFVVGRREQDPWWFLGIAAAPARAIAIWSAGALLLAVVFEFAYVQLGGMPVPRFMFDIYASAGHPALLFVALVVVAPAFEEIVFRGFMLGALRASGLPVWLVVVVTSSCWALVHLQYTAPWLAYIFVLGLVLGAARVRTASIVPCLAMHAVVNFAAFVEVALRSPPAPG